MWKKQPESKAKATRSLEMYFLATNSEDRGLKVRFSLATIAFETFELILCQMLSSQGKNAPSNPYPHYLVRLATSRTFLGHLNCFGEWGPEAGKADHRLSVGCMSRGSCNNTLLRRVLRRLLFWLL